jgi:hypothetical protein
MTNTTETTKTYTYTVVTQHSVRQPDGERVIKTRRKRFTHTEWMTAFHMAWDYAKSISPDTDWSMVPTIEDRYLNHKDYQRSVRWGNNPYAVIIGKGPQY